MSETAPKSERTYSATSSEAAASEGRSDGSVTRKNTLEPARAEAARGLLRGRDRRSADPPRRAGRRTGRSRASARRGRPSSPLSSGTRLDAERLERLLEQAARGERAEEREGGDEARDHERERGREAPEPPAREGRSERRATRAGRRRRARPRRRPAPSRRGVDDELERVSNGTSARAAASAESAAVHEVDERKRRRDARRAPRRRRAGAARGDPATRPRPPRRCSLDEAHLEQELHGRARGRPQAGRGCTSGP